MSTTVQRTPKSGGQSLFFQDMGTPVSSRRGKFSTTGQAAAVSALRHENFGDADLHPPPIFTLEDRSNFSPESGILDNPMSPEVKSEPRTPIQGSGRDFSTLLKNRSEASTSTSYVLKSGQQMQQGAGSLSWWSPAKTPTEADDKGQSSPVEGVVQPGALIGLAPPREVARPEMQKNSLPAANLDEEEWVTVYGFAPGETNLVLREFEKCGVILEHISSPREANWMHILYQKRSDAHKALSKNGRQINGVLVVGVKSVDPMQHHALNERLKNQGVFMPAPPISRRATEFAASGRAAASNPYYLQNGSISTKQYGGGTIASPAKSMVSKVMDLMFGL